MMESKYELVRVMQEDENYIKILHSWLIEEKELENYTCRHVNIPNYEKYVENIKRETVSESKYIFLFVLKGEVLGKIMLFDYNSRNRSAEFGYYLPMKNRKKGIGRKMIGYFLEDIFEDWSLNLHKLYATTASGNIPSVMILEDLGFKLDGRIREHYWFADRIEDQLHYSILKREYDKRNTQN